MRACPNRTRLGWRCVLLLAASLALTACSADEEQAFTGYAEAELVHVAPAGAGRLQSLAVRRGARVDAGDPLFALDAEGDSLAQAAAQARERSVTAQVENLRKGRRAPELNAIGKQIEQARAGLDASAAALARNEQLVKLGFVSAAQLDDLVAARDRDAARLAELQSQLKLAQMAARPDEIAAAEAQRRAASLEADQLGWTRAQKSGSAPVPAIVYDTFFRVGEWVPAGTPVVALLPEGAIKLRFSVPQAMLSRISIGQPLSLSCDGCRAGMKAKVSFISPQAEFTPPVIYSAESRSKLVFLVEAQPIGDAARPLKPGQPLDVRLAPM